MNVKSIVKVMNFHSLLRVDKARKEAQKYFEVETQLRTMIASLTNNRNIVMDKTILVPSKNKGVLNIYIGSDLGFCGGFNYVVNTNGKADETSDKIIIGKKIWKTMPNIVMQINGSDYQSNPSVVSYYINQAIGENRYSEINVLYNRYENASTISWEKRRLYPLDMSNEEFKTKYDEDFVCETNITELLTEMIATYVDYELQITVKNSFASENVMRQNSTSDSLKKIDELEEEKSYIRYKQKMAKTSQKTIENFAKLKSGGGA